MVEVARVGRVRVLPWDLQLAGKVEVRAPGGVWERSRACGTLRD